MSTIIGKEAGKLLSEQELMFKHTRESIKPLLKLIQKEIKRINKFAKKPYKLTVSKLDKFNKTLDDLSTSLNEEISIVLQELGSDFEKNMAKIDYQLFEMIRITSHLLQEIQSKDIVKIKSLLQVKDAPNYNFAEIKDLFNEILNKLNKVLDLLVVEHKDVMIARVNLSNKFLLGKKDYVKQKLIEQLHLLMSDNKIDFVSGIEIVKVPINELTMSFEHHQKRFYVQTERVELLIEIADQIAPNSAKVPPTFKDKIFYSPEHDGFCNKNLEHKHSIEEVIAHIAKKYLEFSKRD